MSTADRMRARARAQLGRDPGRVIPCPHGRAACYECMIAEFSRVMTGAFRPRPFVHDELRKNGP